MPDFPHPVIVHVPTAPTVTGTLRLAAGLGDEGVNWKVHDLGGNRFAFRFKRQGHAALFRSGIIRKGHSVENQVP